MEHSREAAGVTVTAHSMQPLLTTGLWIPCASSACLSASPALAMGWTPPGRRRLAASSARLLAIAATLNTARAARMSIRSSPKDAHLLRQHHAHGVESSTALRTACRASALAGLPRMSMLSNDVALPCRSPSAIAPMPSSPILFWPRKSRLQPIPHPFPSTLASCFASSSPHPSSE